MANDRQPGLLQIAATLDNLAVTREFVRSFATAHGLDAEGTYDLVLAVEEAVTNVIRHGYGEDKEGTIQIEVAQDDGALLVRVLDQAPHFDPTAASAPDLSVPVAERPLGGLGIYMMKKSVDALRYRSLPGGGNELTLVKRIEGRP